LKSGRELHPQSDTVFDTLFLQQIHTRNRVKLSPVDTVEILGLGKFLLKVAMAHTISSFLSTCFINWAAKVAPERAA